MHVPAAVLTLAFGSLVGKTAASPAKSSVQRPPWSSRCYTSWGPSSIGHCPTSHSTLTTACSVHSTSVKSVTVTTTTTLSASTITTTTTTVTTVPTSVSTATSTQLTTTTLTTTATETTSTTSYVDGGTSTTLIPASSGFVPVQSSLPGANFDNSSGTYGPDPAESIQRRNLDLSITTKKPKLNHNGLHSTKVNCWTWYTSSCTTKTSTSTTTKTVTKTPSPVTTTVTVTSTVMPSATTTVSSTSTITTSETVTSTSTATTTTTTFDGTTSAYEACATNNFMNSYEGQGVANAEQSFGSAYSVASFSAGDVYDCCAGVLYGPNAGEIFLFIPNNGATSGSCFYAYSGQSCPTGQATASWNALLSGAIDDVVGNTYCGTITGT